MAHTEQEIREACDYLKNQPDLVEMHKTAEANYKLLTHNLDEYLPEALTRGDLMPLRMATLANMLDTILSDTISLPTSTEAGSLGREYQSTADRVEKAMALWRARADEGRRVTQEARAQFMASPYTVMLLRCYPPEHEGFRWSVEVPDPMTCYPPIKSGPFRPEILAREYEMLVRDVESTYQGNRESHAGTKPYMKTTGEWDFIAIGDDYPEDSARLNTTGKGITGISRVLVREVDYGDVICTSVSGLGSQAKAVVVREVKNLTGGVRAVVIPGKTMPVRGPDRWQAGISAAYQDMYVLNHLRAVRGARLINSKPDLVVEMSPEQITAVQGLGADAAQVLGYFDMAQGTANIVRVPGNPTLWELLPDKDLDLAIQDAKEDLAAIVNSYSETADPQVIKEANTNVFLPYAEARKRKLSPMLTGIDWGWTQMTLMAMHSIKAYNEPFPFTSMGGEHYGKYRELKAGEVLELAPTDIDLDKYTLNVVTRSESDAEVRARVQSALFEESQGLATRRQVIEVKSPDATAQIEALGEDAAIKQNAPYYDQQLPAIFADKLAIWAGVMVQPPLPPPAPTGSTPPQSAVQYQSPVIPGPAGAEAQV